MSEFLTFRAGGMRCALPIDVVEEISRPHAVNSLSDVPPFVLGMTRLRGAITPVVDLGRVLTGDNRVEPRRLVSLRVGADERRVALAVDSVQGVLEFEVPELGALPPLLSDAAAGLVERLGEQDAELLAVLRGGSVLPEELWSQLEALEEAER